MVSPSRILTVCATLVRTGKRIFPQTGWGSHRNDCKKRKRKIDLDTFWFICFWECVVLYMMVEWNSNYTFWYLIEYVHNVALSLHGLELRVSHEGPLRDGFDIVVMEAAVNIKNILLDSLSICFWFCVRRKTGCVCEREAIHMSSCCTCHCTAEKHFWINEM